MLTRAGSEIQASLTGIEHLFQQSLATLADIRDQILDVKSALWMERYNRYKQTIKDLEVPPPRID